MFRLFGGRGLEEIKALILAFGFSKSQLVLYLKKRLENADIIYFKNNCLQSFFTYIYINLWDLT